MAYALRANGTIVAWGTDNFGEVSNTPTGGGFTFIAAGYKNGYALSSSPAVPEPTSTGLVLLAAGSLWVSTRFRTRGGRRGDRKVSRELPR